MAAGSKLTTAQRIKLRLDANNRELDRAAKLKKIGVLGTSKKPTSKPNSSGINPQTPQTPKRRATMKPKSRPTAAPSVSMKPKARPTAAPIRSFRPKMRP